LLRFSGLLSGSLIAVLSFPGVCRAQQAQPSPMPQQGGMQQSAGGMANAGPQKAEFDSQHRPITAGGFVKSGPIVSRTLPRKPG